MDIRNCYYPNAISKWIWESCGPELTGAIRAIQRVIFYHSLKNGEKSDEPRNVRYMITFGPLEIRYKTRSVKKNISCSFFSPIIIISLFHGNINIYQQLTNKIIEPLNLTIFNIIQWDDGTTLWSSHSLMVQCLSW